MSGKELFSMTRKKAIAITCITSMLLANIGTMAVQADPLGDVGKWFSDRADDVSGIASDAGQAIADSDAGKFVSEKTSAAGEAIGNGMSAAGEFIGGHASAAGKWIGTNAEAAGKMIGENAAIAKVWIGDNAKIAGSWIGESASAASDWLGENGSNACNWIVDKGTIVGAWIGETASGAGLWIGENASAAGTKIGETASGVGIWVNEKVTDINKWIEENSLFTKDGIAVLGDNLAEFGIEKKEELEELAIGINDYVKNIDPSIYTTKEYYMQTGEKLLLGEYSDKSMTGLAVGLNLVASIVNLDMAMDLRDLTYDIQYIGDGSVGFVELGIDAASCLPVIGIVKNVKYLDDIKDVAKAVDGIADVADGVKDATKIADVVDDVKDAAKIADVVDDVKDAAKIADAVDDVKDATKIAEVVDDVKDASKIADAVDDVKDASRIADTVDEVKDVSAAAEVADEVKDASTVAEIADDVEDTSKIADTVDEVNDTAKAADDVSDTAKATDAAADAVDEAIEYTEIATNNSKLAGTVHHETGVPFNEKYIDLSDGRHLKGVFPEFDSFADVQLPENLYKASFDDQKKYLIKELQKQVENADANSSFLKKFTEDELKDIKDGIIPQGFVWHHNEQEGLMQLVDSSKHAGTSHTGGMSIWGRGY